MAIYRKIILNVSITAVILFLQAILFADTVRLKSGKIIEGTITERAEDYIKIDIGGVDVTYYLDEIEIINNNNSQNYGFFLPAQNSSLTAEKRADINRLLNLTDALKIGQQVSDFFVAQITSALKESQPNVPGKALDIVREESNKLVSEAMHEQGGYIEAIIRLYDKYFSHDDIKELIKFYQTETGKKTIKLMPSFTQESFALGQMWGQSLQPRLKQRVVERLKKEQNIDLSF